MSRIRYASQLRSKSLLQLFFDFYVLNEVWFRTQGAVHYGYPLTKVLPARKEEAIDITFREKIDALKAQVIGALEGSVREEVRHWEGETREWAGRKADANGEDDMNTGYHADACRRFGLNRHGESWATMRKLPLTVIRDLFFTPCWCQSYGGKKWGEATDYLIKLKESKTIKDDIFLLDRIFDLQHNNGFVLNKTVFATLDDKDYTSRRSVKNGRKYRVKPLNFRFLAGVDEMVEYCSHYVRGLYFANKNYLSA